MGGTHWAYESYKALSCSKPLKQGAGVFSVGG